MPRLFTGLEIPAAVADALSLMRGSLQGARWIDRENYHVTLRFIGDTDGATAREVAALLGEAKPRPPVGIEFDSLSVFGGDRPRAFVARIRPSAPLLQMQSEQERLLRRAGLDAETRKYVPHVTLARLRHVSSSDIAGTIARLGGMPPLSFVATRFVLYSARDAVGGGPYVVEAAYPLGGGRAELPDAAHSVPGG